MLRGILLAIAAGTVAGTAFPVIIVAVAIFVSSTSNSDFLAALWVIAITITVPLCLVSSSLLLLGLPVMLVLKKLRRESEAAYLLAGGMIGFLVPGTLLAVIEGNINLLLFAFPAGLIGAFSGAITGRTWWRQYRAAVAENDLHRPAPGDQDAY